jgi:hypothetical protein
MITIFRGRKLSLQGTEEVIYAEVAVALRDQIHYFNTGKSCNPFAVFMKVALHTDEYGWAFPSKAEISRKTGVTSKDAITNSIRHLKNMRIEGHRILEVWRERMPDGRFGRSLYRIFPDAWSDGLAHIPESFSAERLTPVVNDNDLKAPDPDYPDPVEPDPEEPDPEDRDHKKNHSIKDHQDPRSGSAGLDPTTTGQSSDEPLVKSQPPAEEGSTRAASAFTPCDLAAFIEVRSKYRFKPGGQHDRLLRIVPDRDRQHPAPNDLYLDATRTEAFKAWVLTKIEWAEGEEGRRKPLKSLVSAICNYAQPQFGWFAFWNEWVEQQQGAKSERRGETPGDPGRTKGAGGSPPGQESGAQQRHRAQVARFLASAGRPLG